MKNNSPVYPDLKVGTRLQRTYTDWRGVRLVGKVIGFLDEVDLDELDAGKTEEEATLVGGTIVLELDKACRSRHIDDGSVTEVAERLIYSDEILAEEDWEVTT